MFKFSGFKVWIQFWIRILCAQTAMGWIFESNPGFTKRRRLFKSPKETTTGKHICCLKLKWKERIKIKYFSDISKTGAMCGVNIELVKSSTAKRWWGEEFPQTAAHQTAKVRKRRDQKQQQTTTIATSTTCCMDQANEQDNNGRRRVPIVALCRHYSNITVLHENVTVECTALSINYISLWT